MSRTFVGAPIAAALVKSEDFIGSDRVWKAVNRPQEMLLATFFAARAELARFAGDELRAWASRDASELNAILEREGFAIRVPELGRDDFGVLSILDVLVEWLREGERTEVSCDGVGYPAVRLDSFTVVSSPAHPNPIAVLSTRSGDRVCMTVADQERDGFDLLSAIEGIRSTQEPSSDAFDSLVFPMIDLDQQVELEWIVGMRTTGIARSSRRDRLRRAADQAEDQREGRPRGERGRPRHARGADAAGSHPRPGHRPAVFLLDRTRRCERCRSWRRTSTRRLEGSGRPVGCRAWPARSPRCSARRSTTFPTRRGCTPTTACSPTPRRWSVSTERRRGLRAAGVGRGRPRARHRAQHRRLPAAVVRAHGGGRDPGAGQPGRQRRRARRVRRTGAAGADRRRRGARRAVRRGARRRRARPRSTSPTSR